MLTLFQVKKKKKKKSKTNIKINKLIFHILGNIS